MPKYANFAAALVAAFLAACPVWGQSRDPLPVPDIPGYRTLKCDFHMHTVYSDGDVWPTLRVQEAWKDGLDAIAITDHDDYHPKKGDVSDDISRPYEIARLMGRQLGTLVVPAAEITRGNLHFNALFVKDANAFKGLELATALRQARDQGAFVFWNHPGWRDPIAWFPPVAAAHADGLIQGVELVNGRTFYEGAFPWIREKNLAILSNSDVHRLISIDYGPRERPVTLVFAASASVEGIREALGAHRTAAWANGEVWGGEALLKGLWEGAVTLESSALEFFPRIRQAGLQFRNRSAIPFKLRMKSAPAWLRVRARDIPEEKTVCFFVDAGKEAPAGFHNVAIEFEVTNLHVEPGRNLVVKVPVTVVVAQ
ncbi:MAG: PHP domain-containing protein [Bryobacterales bacterium]|nr:PHP domain-containing protein [Bryobacterales bacterium]